MANVICPRCHERLEVPDDAARARCRYCDHVFALADTRMTADPPAPSQAIQLDLERSPSSLGNIAFDLPEHYANWEEFRSSSPAIQRELLNLATKPLPDLRRISTLPLPEETPAEIDGWSKPLGTLSVPGETWLSNRAAGGMMIGIGLLIVAMSFVVFFLPPELMEPGRRDPPRPVQAVVIMVVGVICTGLGVRFTFFRQPKLSLALWIFEEGLFMRRGGQSTVARFEEVVGYEVSNHTGRPLFWLTIDEEAPIVLSVGHCPEVVPLMEYIEIRMAAAQLLPRLKAIWDGERAQFGVVALDKTGFHGPKFFAPWAEVRKVVPDERSLFVDCGRREWVALRYRDVAFPHLVMAIAHVLIDEHSRI